jgi:hypothetical protein
MTVIAITCDNCGAKYKLPESFKGQQAKCQKCGSVIDVQKQRAAADGGATQTASPSSAARPATGARPAVDRSKPVAASAPKASAPKASAPKASAAKASTGERTARPSRTAAGKRGRAEATDEAAEEGGGRRGRAPKKKSNAMPLIASAVGLVAIAVVAVIMMGGEEKPPVQASDKATTQPANATAPPEKPQAAKVETAQAPVETPPPAPPEAEPAKEAEPAPKETAPPPEPADPGRPLKRWEKVKVSSMDEVGDPKSYPEVVWPDSIAAEQRAEIRGLCDDVPGGGLAGIRAKRQLEEMGYPALFGIVAKLRELDYKSTEESMVAGELNKLLEQMTGGMNAGFEFVELGQDLDPRKAEFNTRTVGAWRTALDKWPDKETFDKARSEALKKQGGDGR